MAGRTDRSGNVGFSSVIQFGGLTVGPGHAPIVIAEMSGNHNQSLDRALAIVDAAAACGCHVLKLQTYTADTLTIDSHTGHFHIGDAASPWHGASLHALYQQAATPWEWHAPIFERCRTHGMVPFSTPFDESAVDFLEKLGAPAYKIASFENVHLPLIRCVARTGKPMIISTGMASVSELYDAVEAVRSEGNEQLILLKCTSDYPANAEDANILTIPHLRELFGVVVGLSDHTPGVGVPCAAVALGASVIEKHLTLRRADGGPDSSFSLEPEEMKLLVDETRRAFHALGKVFYGRTEKEQKSIMFRRSIFAVKDIEAGEAITADNVRIIRPGHGLAPKHLERILGKSAQVRIARGTPISWELLS